MGEVEGKPTEFCPPGLVCHSLHPWFIRADAMVIGSHQQQILMQIGGSNSIVTIYGELNGLCLSSPTLINEKGYPHFTGE